MTEVNLDEKKIKFMGKWVSAEDLAGMIKEKIKARDMKFADIAQTLETLEKSIENSVKVEVKIVLTKDEYNRLKILGENDNARVRRAVMAYIGGRGNSDPKPDKSRVKAPNPGDSTVVQCFKCKTPLEINAGDKPEEIKCPTCDAIGKLEPSRENLVRYKDHFLG